MASSSDTSWFAPVGTLSRANRSVRGRKGLSSGNADRDMYEKHVEDDRDYRRDLCSASIGEDELGLID